MKLGWCESGCKFAFSGRKMQICNLIHANPASQIPSLVMYLVYKYDSLLPIPIKKDHIIHIVSTHTLVEGRNKTWSGIDLRSSFSSAAERILCCVRAWNASTQYTSVIRASRNATEARARLSSDSQILPFRRNSELRV